MALSTFMFLGLDERQISEMIRHEAGHVVIGRALGFPAGDILLNRDGAGADSEHFLSFQTLGEAADFITKRCQVLYGGAVAQALDANNKVQRGKCKEFLSTNANNDMAKIRELSRVLVGMTNPGITVADYKAKLSENDDVLSEAALKIVEANAILIKEIASAFLIALKENIKGAATLTRTPLTSYTFSSAKIDALIAKRPIVVP